MEFDKIQELLRKKAELNGLLNLMPFDGTSDIKQNGNGKYLYVRKRVAGKLTTTYVGPYSEDLYNLLLKNAKESRAIRKELRLIEKELACFGYCDNELTSDIIKNVEFARANMKINIYDQAVLEGANISFRQVEEIINNEKVSGVKASDV